MSIRLSNTTGVVSEDVRVPAENLISAEGEGFKPAMKTLDKQVFLRGRLPPRQSKSRFPLQIKPRSGAVPLGRSNGAARGPGRANGLKRELPYHRAFGKMRRQGLMLPALQPLPCLDRAYH